MLVSYDTLACLVRAAAQATLPPRPKPAAAPIDASVEVPQQEQGKPPSEPKPAAASPQAGPSARSGGQPPPLLRADSLLGSAELRTRPSAISAPPLSELQSTLTVALLNFRVKTALVPTS